MRKILYRELKKRLSRLLLADGGNIVFASEKAKPCKAKCKRRAKNRPKLGVRV